MDIMELGAMGELVGGVAVIAPLSEDEMITPTAAPPQTQNGRRHDTQRPFPLPHSFGPG